MGDDLRYWTKNSFNKILPDIYDKVHLLDTADAFWFEFK